MQRWIPGRAGSVLLVGLIFFFSNGITADDGEGDGDLDDLVVLETRFSPSSIAVGDRVEMSVVVRAKDPDSIHLPEDYPDSQWIDIRSMRMIERGNDREVRVVFSPFRTGALRMPDIDLGAGTIGSQRFRVDTVLPDDGSAQPAPAKPPALLPSFQVIAFAVLVLLVGAPFLLYRVSLLVAARVRRMFVNYRANLPYRQIMRRLRELRTNIDDLAGKEFYIRLVDGLRVYLSGRLHSDFMIATANEMPVLLQGCLDSEELRKSLEELFKRADLVKFAARPSTRGQREADIDMLLGVIASIENRRLTRLRRRANRPLYRGAAVEAD
ncbi:MAG: hypothetical protein ACOCRN_03240 [Spirochaetia bacterium]